MRGKVIFAIALLLCLCTAAMPGLSAAEDEIKIGVYMCMTGGTASYGQLEWAGIQVANQMKPTVLGKKIKLVLADTKSDKVEAANAVSRLIQNEKVVGIIGDAISGNTMAGNPISEAAQIPSISPTATSPLVTQGKKYAFRACFLDSVQGEVAARYAFNELKAETAAVIIDIAQDYCVSLADYFVKEYTKLGGKVIAKTFIQSGDQDFSAQLSTVQASSPAMIYSPNYYTEDALMARQARDLGIKAPILTADGAQTPTLINIGGAAVDGMYLTAHFHKDAGTTSTAKEFVSLYEKEHPKEDMDAFTAIAADAYLLLVSAIERAGSTNGTKIRDALASTKDFDGVTSTITMGEDGTPIKNVIINKVEGGKFVYVTTMKP